MSELSFPLYHRRMFELRRARCDPVSSRHMAIQPKHIQSENKWQNKAGINPGLFLLYGTGIGVDCPYEEAMEWALAAVSAPQRRPPPGGALQDQLEAW